MRKLTWAAIGFGCAAFLAEYALPIQGLPYIAAALAVVSVFSFLLKGKHRYRALICLLCAAAGLLLWRGHYDRRVAPGEAIVGQTVTVTARVTDYPEELNGYRRLTVRILEGAPAEKTLLYLYEDTGAFVPGDLVQGEVRFRSVTDNGSRRLHSYTSEGLYLRGYVESELEIIGHEEKDWIYFPKKLCNGVKALCDRLFSPDTAPFIKALLTGDTDDLKRNEALYGHMRAAGVLHIVAVSGMHLVILVSLVQFLFGNGRRTSLLCLPVMVVFVLMAGCRASVIRAAVMQMFFLLAPFVERESDGATSLSAALLLLLSINPMAIGGVGLQLSFLCVLGFVVLQLPLYRWVQAHFPMGNPVVRFFADGTVGTVCALAFSTPVATLYFGSIPLFSLVSNLFTLPVVEICFAGGYLLCGLGALWPAAASVGAWVLEWGMRWCALVYETVASIPFACLYTESVGAVCWLAGVYVLWIGWLILRRGIRLSVTTPVCLCVIGLCAVFLTGSVRLRPGEGEMTVLDVGQGLCVTIQDDSAVVIVDCGGSEDAGNIAANHLLSRGKDRVELLVLTHLHDDHANGVTTLLSRLPVETVIMPESAEDESGLREEIEAAAALYGVDILCLSRACLAEVGNISLKLYLPQAGTDINERGIVVRAELSAMSAYIMGDAGNDAELVLLSRNIVEDADVLVAGHHGSAGASGILFLQKVQAETAVVSVGQNIYGLPAGEAMERLREYCPVLLRTDEDGNITIKEEAEEISYGEDGEKEFSLW